MRFSVVKEFSPKGDQEGVIRSIASGLEKGHDFQTIVGATGTGKTYVMAKVIEDCNKPALILSHNKTLAAQLYREFKHFFPNNHVEYFVSYYDYYQPEAYVVKRDLYIEKDSSINDEIDRMRLQATASLIEWPDVVVVASVSCIYGLGSPENYRGMYLGLEVGGAIDRRDLLEKLVSIQYIRDDQVFERGKFRVRGDVIDIYLAYKDLGYRVELFGDEVERLSVLDVLNNKVVERKKTLTIFPAKHFVMPERHMKKAIVRVRNELEERLKFFKARGKTVEYERLKSRALYDLELLETVGHCPGIENYSRHLAGRAEGEPPETLLSYFKGKDFVTFIDESHVTLSQVQGMYNGDRQRKQSLVDYGFRLPSALDNRPLRLEEFLEQTGPKVFVSATPGDYELRESKSRAELINRPTGLLDPTIEVRPSEGQIDDLFVEIGKTIKDGHRVLITTLTKKMSEDLTDFLIEHGMKVQYLHSDIETIERVEILKRLRLGEIDILVGINLLREGLDLPEVALVAICDADKVGFLRSATALIQTVGRAARNAKGRAIMYADKRTDAMDFCIEETARRRRLQMSYNKKNKIVPTTIKKRVEDILVRELGHGEAKKSKCKEKSIAALLPTAKEPKSTSDVRALLKRLDFEMRKAGDELDFERAIACRDEIRRLKMKLV